MIMQVPKIILGQEGKYNHRKGMGDWGCRGTLGSRVESGLQVGIPGTDS